MADPGHPSTDKARSGPARAAATAAGADDPGITLAWAAADQTAAVLALLPELLEADVLPPRFVVAHRAGAPSELVGAAALVPVMRHGPSPGFRSLVRVLPGWQRRGAGRALVARLADEARAWDVPHLLAWQAEPDGVASRFMQALGGRVDYTLHHFLIDKTVAVPMCARLVGRLRERGHVPPGWALLPLHQVPRAAVVALHAQEFNAAFEATAAMLARELADPRVSALSFALWNGQTLAGYLLAGHAADQDGDLPEVRFWASDPALRGGWPAALLLEAFVRHASDLGGHTARYHCNANARAPLNVARKCGARELAPTHGWVLDVDGDLAPASPSPSPVLADRRDAAAGAPP